MNRADLLTIGLCLAGACLLWLRPLPPAPPRRRYRHRRHWYAAMTSVAGRG